MVQILARAIVLVVAGATVGWVGNALRPHGLKVSDYAAPVACTGAAEGAPTPTVMSPREAASLCGQPDVVIADTRDAAAFAEGHVAGAVHLPCSAGGATATEALGHFERAQTILVYGASTAEAQPVADSLQRRHQAVRVAVLDGGFAAWSSAGLACASGPCTECKVSNP
jgi:rhodanese-related sulfurtransferase